MNGPHITFFGRLTRDPELQYTANGGVPYVTVGVACNTYRGSEQEQETHFFDATFWRSHAENLAASCRKGQLVFVQGRYSHHKYVRRDGSQGDSHRVDAKELRIFEAPRPPAEVRDEVPDANVGEEPATAEGNGNGTADTGREDHDEVPFE